jgi:hypothetical protein
VSEERLGEDIGILGLGVMDTNRAGVAMILTHKLWGEAEQTCKFASPTDV